MTKKEQNEADRQHSKDRLTKILGTSRRVYTMEEPSRSNMSARVRLFLPVAYEGRETPGDALDIVEITGLVASVIGARIARTGGINVGGCGFSRSHHVVYNLSRKLGREGAELLVRINL